MAEVRRFPSPDSRPRRQAPQTPGTRFFLTVLLLFLTALTLFMFIRSDYFKVTEIVIQGQERLAAGEILEETGLRTGVNIWQIDLRQLRRTLTQNRRIQAAAVQRRLPATLIVTITEYPALALVPYADRYLEVDENGTVLGYTNSIAGKGLPVLTGITCNEPVIGQAVDSGAILPVLQALQSVLGEWIGGLSDIKVGQSGELTLYTLAGARIMLGPADAGLEQALAVLPPILADIKASGLEVEYIDLRLPDKPVVRQK